MQSTYAMTAIKLDDTARFGKQHDLMNIGSF